MNTLAQSNILVVDDTPVNLRLLAKILRAQGYKVLPARSGQVALQAIRSNPPDLILLDIKMPGMDGYQVCQQLKEDPRTRHIPVIFISAMDDINDRLKGFEVGGVDYIGKPFQAEEVLARVHTHLTLYDLQRKLEAQNVQLEGALRLREDLANMIVHDMRNPLAIISGFAYLLKARMTIPKYVEYIDAIRLQSDRLNGFLNDMLMLAKMESRQPVLTRALVDVKQLALETLEHHHVLAEARKIALAAVLPEHTFAVSLDVHLFQRVLDNLISNALKYAPSDSTVTLHIEDLTAEQPTAPAAPAGAVLRVRVLDKGPGIPEAYRERIFDKYEIVDLRKEDVLSIGLGLTFCKMVIEAHGGRIYVEGNRPVGSVFIVEV